MLDLSSLNSDPKCPTPSCPSKLIRIGLSRPVACLHGKRRQRFKCLHCGKKCTENSAKLHFRLRHADPGLNAKIFHLVLHGLSNRQIAHLHGLSPHGVRRRIKRLAQAALAFHHHCLKHVFIHEPVAFDGLENFAGSQYDPNNINQAIGRHSLFTYDFNFAGLNRKGRMSPWQKRRLHHIVATQGRYDPAAIRRASKELIVRIYQKTAITPLVLCSDEHFQYRRVMTEDLKRLKIEHLTVSSKKCRNYQNILFAVNHADLLIRQRLAAFTRETISFSKTPGAMCQKYALFMVHKNYMRAQFTKKQSLRADANLKSPAQKLGLCQSLLGFAEIFSRRSTVTDIADWNEDWQHFWHASVPPKYRRIKPSA
jgi:transposase-like protein